MAGCWKLFSAILALSMLSHASSNSKGCTPLDTLTFKKLTKKFPVSVVKFDGSYPYGDKHTEYEKFAADVVDNDDLLVAEVPIKDYGEKDNEELAKEYEVTKEQFPVVFVFRRDAATGKLESFRFDEKEDEFKADAIKSFVRRKTGLYLSLPGCLKEFDLLANKMMAAESAGDRGKVMAEAERQLQAIKDEDKKKKAEAYVKIMRKLVKEGKDFPGAEVKRLKHVLAAEKISDKNKNQMKQRINILRSFEKHEGNDEL